MTTTVRALEGTTITRDKVTDLECFVCGDKLNFDPEKLDEAVEHCNIRYGVSSLILTEPPLRVSANQIPDVLLENKLSKEEKKLEREEEEQEASAKKEKASVQTKQPKKQSAQQETKTSSRKK